MTVVDLLCADAPGAIGPYSQAIKAGDLLFVSGCIPLDPATGEIVEGIEKQTSQALKNLTAVVTAGGSEIGKVVKTTASYFHDLSSSWGYLSFSANRYF